MTDIKNAIVQVAMEAMDDKKAENIIALDIHELEGTICDYFVICHASSSIQVGAIADFVERELILKLKEKPLRVQGQQNGLWIAMDYGNVMVHIFLDEMRDFYNLEELWSEAEVITL